MKRSLVLLLLFPFAVNAQPHSFFYGAKNRSVTYQPEIITNLKNPQQVEFDSLYTAFGSSTKIKIDTAAWVGRQGTGHLTGGKVVGFKYSIGDATWHDKFLIYDTTVDIRDVWGDELDNDSLVFQTSAGTNHVSPSTDWSLVQFQLRCDTNLNCVRREIDFTGKNPLQRGIYFANMLHTGTPGEYFQMHYDFNVDTGTVPRHRLHLAHTTDYWITDDWRLLYDGPFGYTEAVVAGWGNDLETFSDSMYVWSRTEQGGSLYGWRSFDRGETWTPRGYQDLGWYAGGGGGEMIPFLRVRDKRKINIMWQDRESEAISIAVDVDPVSFFNAPARDSVYYPQIYFPNLSENWAVANSSLGYPSFCWILGDSVALPVWSHERTNGKANLWSTRDNFTSDMNGIPVAPPTITASAQDADGFRLEISGYDSSDLYNVRYFELDISTVADFATFATGKYTTPSVQDASSLQGVRMYSSWDNINALSTATTYYYRIRACNNTGCSSYTTGNTTTL